LLWLVPRSHGHILKSALQWYYVLIHYMAVLFCYFLCRDLGRGRAASIIGGLVFGLAGYVGRTDWPQMLNGAIWAPLVVMFVLRAGRGVRPLASAALAGLCLGLSWLSGHHEPPLYITLASAGLWIYYIVREGRLDWRMLRLAALAIALAVMVGALQILPAQEYGQLAIRWAPGPLAWNQKVPYAADRDLSLYASSLFGIVFPGLIRNIDPFVGVAALALALLGVAAAWKEPLVKVFGAIALGGLIYSLGFQSVFHGMIYSLVPWVEKARVPSREILIFHVGVAALVAYGIDSFLAARETLARRLVLGLTAFGVITFAILFGAIAAKKLNWEMDDRSMITALVALLLAALLHAWRNHHLSARAAMVLLALLIIQEIGNESTYYLAERMVKDDFLESATANQDIADFLHSRPGFFRSDSLADTALIGNWGDYHDLDFYHSYLASATAGNFKLDHASWETRMLFGIRYMIGQKPAHDGQIEVFTARSGLKVYENPRAFPRAWAVHEIVPVESREQGVWLIANTLEDLHKRAFMTAEAPRLEACGGPEAVTIREYTPSRVSLSADMYCAGMLILSDTFFPGWFATVDGGPAQIHEVNFAMRGVVVPKGKHEVMFRYRPRSVIAGAALSLTGLIVIFTLVFIGRKPLRRA
jgi:hypothetical protein